LCCVALQLYKPEKYGIVIELDRFSELESNRQKRRLMEIFKNYLNTFISKLSMMSG